MDSLLLISCNTSKGRKTYVKQKEKKIEKKISQFTQLNRIPFLLHDFDLMKYGTLILINFEMSLRDMKLFKFTSAKGEILPESLLSRCHGDI